MNGSAVLELEVSKVAQDAALRAAGIDTPTTVVAFGREQVLDEATIELVYDHARRSSTWQ